MMLRLSCYYIPVVGRVWINPSLIKSKPSRLIPLFLPSLVTPIFICPYPLDNGKSMEK